MDRKVFVVILFLMGFLTLPSAQTDSTMILIGGWHRNYNLETDRYAPTFEVLKVENNIALTACYIKKPGRIADHVSLILLDISDPKNPEILSEVKIIYLDFVEIITDQNKIYMVYEFDYRIFFQMLEISNKTITKCERIQIFPNGSFDDLSIIEEMVAIEGTTSEEKVVTQILDISDKNNIEIGAIFQGKIQLVNNNLLYTEYNNSTKIFDVSDILDPHEVKSTGLTGIIAIKDNFAYANRLELMVDPETYQTQIESYFYSYDLTEIENPVKADSFNIKTIELDRVQINNDFAYQKITSDSTYIFIINISDPRNFNVVDTLTCFNELISVSHLYFYENYLIVEGALGSLEIFDNSNPKNAELLFSKCRHESDGVDIYTIKDNSIYFMVDHEFKKKNLMNPEASEEQDLYVFPKSTKYDMKFINEDLFISRTKYYDDTTLFTVGFDIFRPGGLSHVKDKNRNPAEFAIFKNYPNPFNPTTTISFQLPAAMQVDIRIYNLMGQQVWSSKKKYQPGFHDIRWHAVNKSGQALSTGVYIIKVKAGDNVATQKAILMK